jgi:3-phenylpropionate/trans-cinnamate dioxygenase ferredoxin component
MGTYVKALNSGELQNGNKKKVSLQGKEIMLARVADKFYAIDNRCAHMGGDLSSGTLEDVVITCPRHGSQFDVTDGRNVRWMKGSGLVSAALKSVSSSKPVKSYKVKVEGDAVMVEL